MKKRDKDNKKSLSQAEVEQAFAAINDDGGEGTEETKEAALERNLQTMRDKWLRTTAEFENYRRRTDSEKSRWIKNATERLVIEICDVLDNFERAIETGIQEHQFDSFLAGVELIHKQLADVLAKEGVKRIEAGDAKFDPMVHDAVSQAPADQPRDTVLAVIQNGYIMHDKVIRPAKVVVSRGPLDDNETENN
ncbi:MAG: nucleotide exchange factor GrpE [Candidatus Cloacimonetes bacterium]|nr:nucleotide exchange factor GrpE [Candidatus Cloacimonadota bacterium]